MSNEEHEKLITSLCDQGNLNAFKNACDNFTISRTARILGDILVHLGMLVYGKKPSYGKFKAIEVIARIPYQSWEVASYMFLTAFYSNEKKAIELSRTSMFGRECQDNETMHVVVMSQLAKKYNEDSLIRHTLIPLTFSFIYFASCFVLYLIRPRAALELNYLFEDHAFLQYDQFLNEHEHELRKRTVAINFLNFYGRSVQNEYDLFVSIRNDEIAHRNRTALRACEYDHMK